MKVRLAKIAAALLIATSATVQADMATADALAPATGSLYGKEAVDRYNELVKLQFNVIQEGLSIYRQCMEMRLAIVQRGGTPTGICSMPNFSPPPPLQWLETDPRKEPQ